MTALSDRLLFQYRKDPLAKVDSFETLSHHEREELWSFDDGTTLQQKIEHLDNFTSITFIDVKLVGFDGDGYLELSIPEKDFLRFFEDLKAEVPLSVLKPEAGYQHSLPVRVKNLYQIVKAKHELSREIQHALQEAVVTYSKSEVPINLIDSIIERDFRETSLSTTIYILNPKIPVDHKGREVAYTYREDSHPCPTSVWVGKDERYMWIDISASTPAYGPSTMGEGVVTEYTMPRLAHYTKQGKVLTHELMSHLVALVKRTCHHVIDPSLQYFPVPLFRRTTFQLLRIGGSSSKTNSQFDWKVLMREITKLQLADQTVLFREHHTSLQECAECAFALESARRTVTSTPEGSSDTTSVEYIDSHSLHSALTTFEDKLPGYEESQFPGERVVRIYLFDLDSEKMLLFDQHNQAQGFKDTVLVLQTQAGKLHLDMSCDGKALSVRSNDATRAALASILTTVWAVSPTHITWDDATQKPVQDFLWSTSLSVFGPLSAGRELTFTIRDAAARAVLYTTVHGILAEASSFATDLAKYHKELDDLLNALDHKLFLQRWNVFKFKLEKAGLYLSLHNFEHALYYLRSLQHDTKSLHSILQKAGKSLHFEMTCWQVFDNPNAGSSHKFYVFLVVVCCMLYMCLQSSNNNKSALFKEKVIRSK